MQTEYGKPPADLAGQGDDMIEPASCKLSICIATRNRGHVIGTALQSILDDAPGDFEIVVLDGASSDNTEQLVTEYARTSGGRLRYFRQETANGLDRDFDRTVELARGEYCWFMCDDDLLKEGAVAAVLRALQAPYSLVILTSEITDAGRPSVVLRREPDFAADRIYGPAEIDRLAQEVGRHVMYIASLVIRRDIWLARERQRYYGSLHAHVGVVFQQPLPGPTLLIAAPLIIHRFGNQSWLPRACELLSRWPPLVQSLAISADTKQHLAGLFSPQSVSMLLPLRAAGLYSWSEYQRWFRPQLHSTRDALIPALIALLPCGLIYAVYWFYSYVTADEGRSTTLALVRNTRLQRRASLQLRGTSYSR